MALKPLIALKSLFVVSALFSGLRAASPEWEPVSFLAFADHLFAQGDYARAAGEYERYLSVEGAAANRDSIGLKTGFSYLGAHDYAKAQDYFQKASNSRDSGLAVDARLNLAFLEFRKGEYDASIREAEKTGGSRAQLLIALNDLHLRQWEKAGAALETVDGEDTLSNTYRQLKAAQEAGRNLRPKNLAVAGLMSAVIPGSGKMYAGRIKDGVFSLALVGLTGALAWQGFHEDGLKSVQGWVLGAFSLGFYGGNVYGSVLAARQHNLIGENRVLDDLSYSVNAKIPF